jgi:ABC-type lipoprotein export system ATPase subunit
MADNLIITADHIQKTFHVGGQEVQILRDISLQINRGDFVVIFGPSGCGKSTLLHIILGLESPSAGVLTFLGQNLYSFPKEDDRSDFRKHHIGMVYQQPNWIKSLTVLENVGFPLTLLGQPKATAFSSALDVLNLVNMANWANYIPTELSSGQQQRIALARALVTNPEVIIADEPTGNLDFEGGQQLMQLLRDLNEKQQKTILMVTHDLDYIRFAKVAIHILDGKVIANYDESNKSQLYSTLKGRGKRNAQITE